MTKEDFEAATWEGDIVCNLISVYKHNLTYDGVLLNGAKFQITCYEFDRMFGPQELAAHLITCDGYEFQMYSMSPDARPFSEVGELLNG
jgi:hypothetical protein